MHVGFISGKYIGFVFENKHMVMKPATKEQGHQCWKETDLLVLVLNQQIHITRLSTLTKKLSIYIHLTCSCVPGGLSWVVVHA